MKVLFILSVVSSIAFKQINAQNETLSMCNRVFASGQRYQSKIYGATPYTKAQLSCKPENSTRGLHYECQGNSSASGLFPTNQYCTAVWGSENVQTRYECWDFAFGTDFGPFGSKFHADTYYHCPDTRLLLSYSRHVGSGGTTDYCAQVGSSAPGVFVPHYSELVFFEPLAQEYYFDYSMTTEYSDCGSAVLDEGTEIPISVDATTETPTSTPVTQAPTAVSSSSTPTARSYCEQEFYSEVSSERHVTYEITNRTIECFSSEMIRARNDSSLLQHYGLGIGGIGYACPSNSSLFMTFPYNHHCVTITEGTYEDGDGVRYAFQGRNECSDYAVETNFSSFGVQATAMDWTLCAEEMWYRYMLSTPVGENWSYCGDKVSAASISGESYPIYSGLGIDEDLALQWVSDGRSVYKEMCANETGPDLSLEPNSVLPSVEEASIDDAVNDDPAANERSGHAGSRTTDWFSTCALLAAAFQIFVIA